MIDTPRATDAEAGLLHFPDLIETAEDTPVLLTALLSPELDALPVDGIFISRINGIAIDATDGADVPGIRIGNGSGSGYVMRRPMDSQLVFVPDAGFSGLTFFRYTVADRQGEEATLVATISVRPEAEPGIANGADCAAAIKLSHGLQTVSLPAGVGAAILGALTVERVNAGSAVEMRVYEDDQSTPSERFLVLNGTLRLIEPLESAEDGEIIKLSVVAVAGNEPIARCEIDVRISSGHSDQFNFAAATAPAQPSADDEQAIFVQHGDSYEWNGTAGPTAVQPDDAVEAGASAAKSQSGGDDPFGG